MAAQSNTHSCNASAIPALIFLLVLSSDMSSSFGSFGSWSTWTATIISYTWCIFLWQNRFITSQIWVKFSIKSLHNFVMNAGIVQFPDSITWQWTLHIWQDQNPHSVFMASKNADTPTSICIKLFMVCTADCSGHSQCTINVTITSAPPKNE